MDPDQMERDPRLTEALQSAGEHISETSPDINQLAEEALVLARAKLSQIGETRIKLLQPIYRDGPIKPVNFVLALASDEANKHGTRPISFGDFGEARICLMKEQERIETESERRGLLRLIGIDRTRQKTVNPGGGPALICAVFENNVAIPIARIADIKGKHSSYIQIGDEILDDNLLTTHDDEPESIKKLYRLIHILISSGDSSTWPIDAQTEFSRQITRIKSLVMTTLIKNKESFQKASINKTLEQLYYRGRRQDEQLYIQDKDPRAAPTRIYGSELTAEFSTPSGRRVRFIAGKELDEQGAPIKVYAIVRGYVAIEIISSGHTSGISAEKIEEITTIFKKLNPAIAELMSIRRLIRDEPTSKSVIQIGLRALLEKGLVSPSHALDVPGLKAYEPYADTIADLQPEAGKALDKEGLAGLFSLLGNSRWKLDAFQQRYLEAQIKIFEAQRSIATQIGQVLDPILLEHFGPTDDATLQSEVICNLAIHNLRQNKALIEKSLVTPINGEDILVKYCTRIEGQGSGRFKIFISAYPPSGVTTELPVFAFNILEPIIVPEDLNRYLPLYREILET